MAKFPEGWYDRLAKAFDKYLEGYEPEDLNRLFDLYKAWRDENKVGFNRVDLEKLQAEQARFVTSVCTGALLLGAAGLLQGYRATHWLSLDMLRSLGAKPVAERVVVDRNRITGAGVTSGIDMALPLASLLHGDTVAQEIQLMMEYAPAPPFQAGSPSTAPADIVERVTMARQAIQEERQRILSQIGRRPD